MTERRERNILFIIILIGVLLRVGAALYLGPKVEDLPGTADQISYHNLALRVLGGHGFTFGEPWWPATPAGAPTAHWSYLYTGFLVAVYSLFGPNALAARIIQAVLVGMLHPLLAYALGRRIFGRTVGVLAAAFTALYAYFIYYAANLMTEPFYISAILASLLLAIRLADSARPPTMDSQAETPEGGVQVFARARPNLWLAVALGLSLAAVVLLRQLFLLFIPFLFLWLLLSNFRRQLLPVLIAGTIIVLAIIPFTLFNYSRFGRFVLLNTNAGFAFFWGNHPIYGTHFIPILPEKMGTYLDLIPQELRSLDEAALDQALLKRGLQFVVDDPGRYILLSISRIPAYFMFWPSSDSGTVSNLSRVLSFGIFWPFMAWGLLVSFWQKPSPFRLRPASPLLLLYLFMLVYTGVHLLTWALIRYRLPVDAVLVVFAGQAIEDLVERIPALRRIFNPSGAGIHA